MRRSGLDSFDKSPIPPIEPGGSEAAGVWKSVFGWRALFRWDVLGSIVPGVFLAVAFGVLGIDWFPGHLQIAQLCFGIAAALCVAKFIGQACEARGGIIGRVAFAVLATIVILFLAAKFELNVEEHKNLPGEPPIVWDNPKPIYTNTPLSENELNATSTVKGSWSYDPNYGYTLPVGTNTLSVTFTPNDYEHYLQGKKSVSIVVQPSLAPPARGSSTEERRLSLQRRANSLAEEIIGFVYAREGPMNSWKVQAMSSQLIDHVINGNPNAAQDFKARLQAWNNETRSRFLAQYWTPQVVPLLNEIKSSGNDISPVTNATATGDPRKIGLMLSVIAARIGKRPPFPRELTPLEADSIVRGSGNHKSKVEIYAYSGDPNSMNVAETLRESFRRNWLVDKAVLPLRANNPVPRGIKIYFLAPDLAFNFDPMTSALDACELDPKVDFRKMNEPTFIQIEVWPAVERRQEYPTDQLMPPDRRRN